MPHTLKFSVTTLKFRNIPKFLIVELQIQLVGTIILIFYFYFITFDFDFIIFIFYFILIFAKFIFEIHWLSHTNKCTVLYCTSLKFTLKTFKSS
jgi:hypothetical protein